MCLKSCEEGDLLAQAMKNYFGWKDQKNKEKGLKILDQILPKKEKYKKKYGEEYLSYCYNLKALFHLGHFPRDTTEEVALAIKYFQKGAEMNNPDSFYQLALIYNDGEKDLIEKNVPKAIEFFETAISLRHSDSMFQLGYIYLFGEDLVEKNLPKALFLIERAGVIGHPQSLNLLGEIYENYEYNLVEKDILKAISFYEKADLLNFSSSTFQLASIYENGSCDKNVIVEQDLEKSVSLYYKASLMGQIFAAFSIAEIIQKNKISWKEDYHRFWKVEEDLNHQILMILCVSKHRRYSSDRFVSSFLVRGISMKIIQFLCHLKQSLLPEVESN